MAKQPFEIRNIASGRRFASNGWTFELPNSERKECFEVVRKDINRARVRLGLEEARARVGINGEIRDVAESFAQDSAGFQGDFLVSFLPSHPGYSVK